MEDFFFNVVAKNATSTALYKTMETNIFYKILSTNVVSSLGLM